MTENPSSKEISKFTVYVEHDKKTTNLYKNGSSTEREAIVTPLTVVEKASKVTKFSDDNEKPSDKATTAKVPVTPENLNPQERQVHKKPNIVDKMPRIDEEDEEEVAAEVELASEEAKSSKNSENIISQNLKNDKPTKAIPPVNLNPQEREVHKKPNIVDKMPRIDEEDEEEVAAEVEKASEEAKSSKNSENIISQNLKNDKPTMAITPVNLNSQERQVYKKPNIVDKMPRIDEEDEEEVASSSTKATIGGKASEDAKISTGNETKKPMSTILPYFQEIRRSSLTMGDESQTNDTNTPMASNENKFCNEFFECHNKYRKLHGVPALKSLKKLAKRAAARAQYLSENNIRINDLIEYGESIHIIRGSVVFTAQQIAKFWYDQNVNFDFDTGLPGPNSAAFTQMIWKTTREFGCATARAFDCTWIVAIYNPPGNYVKKYINNVPPAISADRTDTARDSSEKDTFVSQCLEAHNKYRQLHGCPSLKLNTSLCDAADEWVQTLAEFKKLKDRENTAYGSNMFQGESVFILTGEQVVKIWYDENTKYNYNAGIYTKKTGHFTQVIWRNTRDLGVGYIRTGFLTFVVCYYDPAGNYPGEFLINVPRIGNQQLQRVDDAAVSDDLPFELQVLTAHNKYRKLHGCPPLVLSKELSALALEWANELFNNNSNVFTFIRTSFVKHRPNTTYGENTVFAKNVPSLSGERVVKAWYDEISKFDFDDPKFTVITAHFTQIIWASTKELGVGMAKMNNNTWVVCNYSPPGNMVGEFKLNVPKLGSPTFVDYNFNIPFGQQCLIAHNQYRALHGCPPLELSPRLTSFAAQWANILCELKKMQRRPSNIFGENICMGSGSADFTGERVVKAWYKEISNYNFNDPKFSTSTQHFTQVIWKSTKEFGVSLIKNNDATIVVAYYSPAGNLTGDFADNVPRLLT